MNRNDSLSGDIGQLMASIDPAASVTEMERARSRARCRAFATPAAHVGPGLEGPAENAVVGEKTHPKFQPRPARSFRRRAVLTAAAAVLLVGGFVAADVVLPGNSGASAEAAEVLNNAAAAAIKTSDPVVGPGQYLKVETDAVSSAGWAEQGGRSAAWLDRYAMQVYVPADRTQEWVWNRGPRLPEQYFNAEAEAVAKDLVEKMEKANSPRLKGEVVRANGGAFYGMEQNVLNGMRLDEIPAIPRDPKELLSLIYHRTVGAGPSAEIEAVTTIADTLRTGIVPADLRAALYRSAALIPGVTLVDHQATLAGRTGIAIGIEGPFGGGRQDIIIDPSTGLMIGERKIALKATDDFPAGTATGWTAVRTSVVDSAP